MESGLRTDYGQQHVCEMSLLLSGFEVEAGHSYLLCLREQEWTYSKKRRDQQQRTEREIGKSLRARR